MNKLIRVICIACLSIFLFSCSSGYQAPVSEVAGGPRFLDTGRQHRVNEGETLYSISWVYDLDYQLLAQVNNLRSPYTIVSGQLLTVDVHGVILQQSPVNQPQTVTSTQGPTVTNSATVSSQPAPNYRQPLSVQTVDSWVWPASGPVVSEFSSSGQENKGIDIGGKAGDDVLAASSGEVVYAGTGVLRYGDLIILKHNEQYLSAYAHNSRLLVSEGDQVRQGQKIAEVGSSGISREMLHFEIRLSGAPVDPLSYLPPR